MQILEYNLKINRLLFKFMFSHKAYPMCIIYSELRISFKTCSYSVMKVCVLPRVTIKLNIKLSIFLYLESCPVKTYKIFFITIIKFKKIKGTNFHLVTFLRMGMLLTFKKKSVLKNLLRI